MDRFTCYIILCLAMCGPSLLVAAVLHVDYNYPIWVGFVIYCAISTIGILLFKYLEGDFEKNNNKFG